MKSVEVLETIQNTQLNYDVFIHIASHLDDQVMESLEAWNSDYVNHAKNTKRYWKEKIEILLKRNISIEYNEFDVENIYKELSLATEKIYTSEKAGLYPSLILSVIYTGDDEITAETIKLLLELNYNPIVGDQTHLDNNTLLSAIFLKKYKTAMILLEDHRINPSIEVTSYGTALYYVCFRVYDARYNHDLVEFVKMLLKDKHVLGELDNIELLRNAIMFGYTEVVKLIIEKTDIDTKKLKKIIKILKPFIGEQLMTFIFFIDIFKNRPEFKDSYLASYESSGQNINSMSAENIAIEIITSRKKYDSAFLNAAMYGNLNIIKKLKELPINENETIGKALRRAAINGHIDVVEFLMKNYKINNFYITNAISGAINSGYIDVVELLMKTGVLSL